MKEIKYLVKNSKYIIPFLTALSLLNVKLFYSAFDIKIGSYLSFDEFLTPFIDDMMYYAIVIIFFHILIMLFVPETWKIYYTTKVLEKRKLSYLQRLRNDFTEDGYWLLISLILSIVAILQGVTKGNYSLIFLPLNFLILHIRREIIIRHPQLIKTSLEFLNVLLLMSSLVLLSLLLTFSDVYIKKHAPQKKIVINMLNDSILCKDSISYIGRVKNHTFIYNQKTKSTTTLNNSDIKKVTFY